jgi:hypothetical protein
MAFLSEAIFSEFLGYVVSRTLFLYSQGSLNIGPGEARNIVDHLLKNYTGIVPNVDGVNACGIQVNVVAPKLGDCNSTRRLGGWRSL